MLRLLLVVCMLSCGAGARAEDSAEREIQYLLDFVASSGCIFIRNGSEHSSVDAADHLRLKYRRGRRYAGSADYFIDRLASGSSFSGKPYMVRCGDLEETSGAWLHRALQLHRDAAP